MSDTFGPWTPPGTGGTQPTGDDDPGPTTPAILTEDQFWDSSTVGYIQVGEAPAWQRCELGPFHLPGLVEVEVDGAKLTIDAKAAQAKGGETLTTKGWTGSKITISCLLWTPAHLKYWREMAPQIDPTIETEHKPLDIAAECLKGTSIKMMQVECVHALKRGHTPGTRIGVIDGKQSVGKPKTVGTGTPTGSKGNNPEGADHSTNAYIVLVKQYITYCNSHGWIPWNVFLGMNSIDYPYPEPPASVTTPSGGPP
jgi:hypothetical protein